MSEKGTLSKHYDWPSNNLCVPSRFIVGLVESAATMVAFLGLLDFIWKKRL